MNGRMNEMGEEKRIDLKRGGERKGRGGGRREEWKRGRL